MKRFILLLLVISMGISYSYAQEWKKYHRNDLGLTYTLVAPDNMTYGRHFRINPYDNSLWMTTQYTIQTMSMDGTKKFFRLSNTPAIVSPSNFVSFEFLPNKVFILDNYNGIYLYENENLSLMHSASGLFNAIATDGDTLYIVRENNPMVKWTDQNLFYLFDAGYTRNLTVKNNLFWASEGYGPVGGVTVYTEDGSYTSFNPINSAIMDFGNFDHKFSPHHDTLYVAGNKGLSLLHNLTFFDSIAPDNTTNMPPGVILDFEFDANDNIWALFGSDAQTPTSIAHYDQAIKNWDIHYDAGNANLNFDTYCSIELDNLGNLWMVNQAYIHVLELSTLPDWLSVKQPKLQASISVYPNPAKGTVSIETDALLSEIYLTDQLGKRLRTFNPTEKQFSVAELPAGMYFVELITEQGEKSTVKLVKE